jgi:hypothetical protein
VKKAISHLKLNHFGDQALNTRSFCDLEAALARDSRVAPRITVVYPPGLNCK